MIQLFATVFLPGKTGGGGGGALGSGPYMNSLIASPKVVILLFALVVIK